MAADILEFPHVARPKAAKLPPKRTTIALVKSWDEQFFNPYLNSIYNSDISYIERWYLETKYLIQHETSSNLLNQLILDKEFCKEFLDAIDYDLAMCIDLLNDSLYRISAEQLIRKLKLWRKNFLYCFNQ